MQNRSITGLMLDIDFFKEYNDYYGHPKGDERLRKISSVINEFANKEGVCKMYET